MVPEGDCPLQLPVLSSKPIAYSGSCLGLSSTLLSHLHSVLPNTAVILSIGSGAGLLEALLNGDPYCHTIIGVEVEPSPNRYLPPENHDTVHGTRFLSGRAAEATAWMFIYPRRVGLLEEYIKMYGGSVELVVWIGPKADWDDYQDCFQTSTWDVGVQGCEESGGRLWELMAIARKRERNKIS
ncbi:hypothetical protein P154DRAFT_254425 [Amniculicola lignicola CBS 123094]|uniref:Uncharacterized protein n=1 Tax=Amniculicola lignicola CBS 123094 TaxID=1392246 RepID=A0A6A5WX31_9PLEO|nr:hypothetical protein P154DRAFT_254425 [Amniculicola lignicola CBS 123094]